MKPVQTFYLSRWICTGFVLLSTAFSGVCITQYFNYNAKIQSCYKKIVSLRLVEAETELKTLKSIEPNNLAIIHLENYKDFFHLFISENELDYKRLLPNLDSRIEKLENIPVQSPYYRFVHAEILLQWALIRLKFNEKLKAGTAVYQAYKLLEKNKELYPDFIENNKSLSVIHVLAETLPKWVQKATGVKGSISLGTKEIQSLAKVALANDAFLFREEVAAIYSYITLYQNNKKAQALMILKEFKLDHTINPLAGFLKAGMFLKNGDNEACIKILLEVPKGEKYTPFYYLDFMLGRSKLYRQDIDADKYILKFIENFRGRHYIKEAYQKLAWYELSMNGDQAAYTKYMSLALSKGFDLVDEDKQALKEAKTKKTPNEYLLKSRIYFDGGYYTSALNILAKNIKTLQGNPQNGIEYHYRMGRIYQVTGKIESAITEFNYTINKDTKKANYFSCSAALQLGIIYEEKKMYKEAKRYYNICVTIDSPEYKSSLHQKAKSGLQRVSNK